MPVKMPVTAPLTVIIPTLNAAKTLPGTLQSLQPGARLIHKILVVDGGSTDGTEELVVKPARLLRAPRGRGIQLHAGAQAANSPWLLFLHADTKLQKNCFFLCPKFYFASQYETGSRVPLRPR